MTHWDSWFVSPLRMGHSCRAKATGCHSGCSLHLVKIGYTWTWTLEAAGRATPEVTSGVTDACSVVEGSLRVTLGYVVEDD